MTTLRDAGEGFPLIQAWRDGRDVALERGWKWPSRVTVWRHWQALHPAQRLHARRGRAEAIKALAQPAMRDKTTISALEWVSLDGRTKDFWAHIGDGKSIRVKFLALVDVASNKVIGWEVARSENATDTVKLIRRTCKTYGIFDRLYTDNGTAFAGHLVAGGNVHKFRNSGSKVAGVRPLGICYHLEIDLRFALPGNGQAKTAERTFAIFSRNIDDRPEFKKAHCGHAAGAAPDSKVIPVYVDMAKSILQREVDRYNRELGRRSQGARGRSYDAVCEAGLAGAYDSKEGVRDAARNRKAARDATDRAAELNGYLSDADFAAALADLGTPQTPVAQPEKVVAARFGSPLQKPRAKGKAAPDRGVIPAEHYQNLKTRLAELKASGEKLA